MRERCLQHGLAVGPDGTCVLCRSRAREKQSSKLGLVITLLVVAVTGGVVWKIARSWIDRQFTQVVRADAPLVAMASATVPPLAGSATGMNSSQPAQARLNAPPPIEPAEHQTLSARDPRGLPSQLQARGETDVVGAYFPGKESYELVVPAAAATEPHGLLVWINSGPSGSLPNPEWGKVLATHRLVWAGPNRVGNDREVALRIGLALDAVRAASQRFSLDSKRVYVGGFSGGAKSAFRALLYYPDVFHGALLASGAEYFRPLPVHSRPQGGTWPSRYGTPSDLALAKSRPVALVTGPNDFNFGQISDVVSGMLEDRFARVQLFSWQDLGHAPPPADALDRALTWLDGRMP